MTATPACAAPTVNARLEPTTIERRPVRDADVRIEIRYCGVCHTDVTQTADGWGPGLYPMVPGHEITGIVVETGPAATKYSVGDRVGVGTYVDSCRECEACRSGLEVYKPPALRDPNSRPVIFPGHGSPAGRGA